jgi:hypothetical protein
MHAEERRRVDDAVIENRQARTFEVTSLTAKKEEQQRKEKRIREAGGTYIHDRRTGQIVPVADVSEVVRIK